MLKKVTTNDFIDRARTIHGNKYNYDFSIYINAKTKVIIICPVHGVFLQTPDSHLHNHGCKQCGIIKRGLSWRNSQNDIISRFKIAHGDKYNYSLVNYKTLDLKVNIVCKKHGVFKQTPLNHIHGNGCPKCEGHYDGKYYFNDIPLYYTYAEKLKQIGIDCKRNNSDKNILDIRCYLCKKWFTPKLKNVSGKIRASNNVNRGENNLYCSHECKIACPTFNFDPTKQIDPRSKLYVEKTESQKARACQTDIIKQLQCSDEGKMYCEICGNEIFVIDAELHHTLPISEFGMKASDHESQMLLCTKCHLKLHGKCKS